MKWKPLEEKELEKEYMEDKTLKELFKKFSYRTEGSVRGKICAMELSKKYFEKHGTHKPRGCNQKVQHRRGGLSVYFEDDELWLVWYFKHHTNLSNREIGNLLERSKSSINSIVNVRSLLISPPQSPRPANLEEIANNLMNGVTLPVAIKEVAKIG